MDGMLTVLTLFSIAIAAGSGAVTWRVLREERRRSEARTAALAAAIDGPRLSQRDGSTPGAPLFDAPRAANHAPRILRLAVGAAMAVLLLVAVAMSTDRTGTGVQSATATTPNAPLELLSMRHERDGDGLTVNGLVRNRADAAAGGVIAVVFAFDSAGNFLAGGRAPLELVTLGAGEASPFRVALPRVGDVARYRVTFRTESGVVRHVDRRPNGLAAQQSSRVGHLN